MLLTITFETVIVLNRDASIISYILDNMVREFLPDHRKWLDYEWKNTVFRKYFTLIYYVLIILS